MEGGKRWRNEGGERGERKCFLVGLWGVVCVCGGGRGGGGGGGDGKRVEGEESEGGEEGERVPLCRSEGGEVRCSMLFE